MANGAENKKNTVYRKIPLGNRTKFEKASLKRQNTYKQYMKTFYQAIEVRKN